MDLLELLPPVSNIQIFTTAIGDHPL
jgi:hypothetical protein